MIRAFQLHSDFNAPMTNFRSRIRIAIPTSDCVAFPTHSNRFLQIFTDPRWVDRPWELAVGLSARL